MKTLRMSIEVRLVTKTFLTNFAKFSNRHIEKYNHKWTNYSDYTSFYKTMTRAHLDTVSDLFGGYIVQRALHQLNIFIIGGSYISRMLCEVTLDRVNREGEILVDVRLIKCQHCKRLARKQNTTITQSKLSKRASKKLLFIWLELNKVNLYITFRKR